MKPFFSIILATYNQANFLKKSLKSILNQTYQNWELIIIDNNSTDHTDKVIKNISDKRFRTYKINNKNILAKSRNLGIKKSKSDWVCFIDSDDIWYSKKLEITKDYIEKNNGDIFYHDLVFTNKFFIFKKKKIHDKSQTITKPVIEYFARNGNGIGQSSVVIKKKILKDIGYISEDNKKYSWEDFDTWIRVSKLTQNFVRIPKILGSLWVGPENISTLDRQIVNSKNISEYYGDSFKKLLKLKSKKKIWWLEYPFILNDYKKKRYSECLNKINKINTPNKKIYLFLTAIKYKMIIIQIFNYIHKILNIIILFKNIPKPRISFNNKNKYQIISKIDQLKNKKFKNFDIPNYFYHRLHLEKNLHLIYDQTNLISYGWSSVSKKFKVTEINCNVVNNNNVIFFDFHTIHNFRKKGFYKILIQLMQNNYKNIDCYIFTNLLNIKSFLGIIKSNFKISKILTILSNKISIN